MAYELERVSNVSTACTAVFLLYLPVKIWQLFKSSTTPSSGSKSFINAVSVIVLLRYKTLFNLVVQTILINHRLLDFYSHVYSYSA